MKIILEYDETTQQVLSEDGMVLWYGEVKHFGEYKEQPENTQNTPHTSKVSSVIELKKAGFSADEIVEMTRGGVL